VTEPEPKAADYRHILVAVDASEPAKRAVARAARLARGSGARLTIVHMIRQMQVPERLLDMADVEKITGVRGDLLEMVAGKILREAKEIAAANGLREVGTSFLDGDPASGIVDRAREIGADLIVLGTRGLGKIRTAFLGSVSRKVTNLSEFDVLVVR
jgi:nucleotide-binding universal stress UspA family protein